LVAVALLLALWTTTMFVDSASPLITAPSAVIPLVAIFALPVIAIGVGGRHYVSATIATVAALLPWTMLAGYASARELPTGQTSTVRVMAVDGAGGAADAAQVAQAAQDYAADVVIIIGLDTGLAHDLTVAGLDEQTPPVWVNVENGATDGIGVWSRLTLSGMTTLQGFTRRAAAGLLEVGDARVGVTVAQLPGNALVRATGWNTDLAALADQQVDGAQSGSFLVGSLNVAPWQPAFRSLERAGWEDAADVAGKGLRPTWPAWSPVPFVPSDHLLVDQELGVTSTATVRIDGSSHRALVASLEVPTG